MVVVGLGVGFVDKGGLGVGLVVVVGFDPAAMSVTLAFKSDLTSLDMSNTDKSLVVVPVNFWVTLLIKIREKEKVRVL